MKLSEKLKNIHAGKIKGNILIVNFYEYEGINLSTVKDHLSLVNSLLEGREGTDSDRARLKIKDVKQSENKNFYTYCIGYEKDKEKLKTFPRAELLEVKEALERAVKTLEK